jgi:hypothetical protein
MKKEDYLHIAEEISISFSESIKHIVSDFYSAMPQEYIENVSPESQKDHLKTIIAGRTLDIPQDNFLLKDKQDQYTFISLQNRSGQLAEFLRQLPEDKPLTSADIFTSRDNQFVIDIFSFTPQEKQLPMDEGVLNRIAGTEAIQIDVDQGEDCTTVKLFVDNAQTTAILKRLAAYCASRNLDIRNVGLHNHTAHGNNSPSSASAPTISIRMPI